MAIWTHKSHDTPPCAELIDTGACLFCTTGLRVLNQHVERDEDPETIELYLGPQWKNIKTVFFCPTCGWWKMLESRDLVGMNVRCCDWYGACAQLAKLDLADLSQPLEEVRRYLLARFERRFEIHPRLFEMTVASVFRSLGYSAHVTAYSNDGGIDAVLESPADGVVGVQVKRYRDTIKVEQIRAFTGSLFINGYTRGVFVTTSSFQSGAAKTCDLAALRGVQVELIDAPRFYDALKITTRAPYQTYEEWQEATGDVELAYLTEVEY